ncbi:hypothetical protein QE373_002521 [Stenotrophomonas sp. SORGH_AS321]|nr:hypothetical protein [Stenotrophomonas sp. SORGH_AS_0321]
MNPAPLPPTAAVIPLRVHNASLPARVDPRPLRVALVAGEASGDLLGAGLVSELKARFPNAEFAGIGGDSMRGAGCQTWFDASELAVMGLTEVLRHLPRLLKLRAQFRQRVLEWQPDVFIGIDAPDFQPARGALAEAAWHPHRALRQPFGVGLAREARREDRRQRRPGAVPVSDGTADLRPARDRCSFCRPSDGR